jgi:hypothetical protein
MAASPVDGMSEPIFPHFYRAIHQKKNDTAMRRIAV